jgi:hypothetical protein
MAYHSARKTFRKQPKNLNLEDRLGILFLEMRLSGVAEQE